MAERRILAQAPTLVPIVDGGRTRLEWERWFSLVAEHVVKRQHYHVTFNPTSVAANTTSEQSITITGIDAKDDIKVSKPSHTAGLGIVNTRAAKDTVYITFMNVTGSPIDPPEEEYTILVLKV